MNATNHHASTGAAGAGGSCLFSFLIPTRNNLPGLKKLFESIVFTTERVDALEIILAIDEDDTASQAVSHDRLRLRKVVVPKGLTMGALNNACFEASAGRYLMLMNDDVVLRSQGWDRQMLAVYRQFPDDIALIHVNDLLFRERLCTFPMLSRRACQEIGLCPTAYRRYRIDDHIYDTYNLLAHLGYRRIIYLPDVIFEHENHDNAAAPAQGHQFASADKKVYVPKAGIIEADAKYCDDHFDDRKAAALKLAELIENDAHCRGIEGLRQRGRARLAALTDSYSYRRPAYLQTLPTGIVRDSSNTRTTVVVVTAGIQSEVAQRCLQAIKAHTTNYDLVILDNNRGPNFSHPEKMNQVLETCRTDFLVLLDDDVIVEAGWLDGLLRCVDEETGVVVPLHKDGKGTLSFSGIYFTDDGTGAHAHTLDRPAAPRVVQAYCSAAMLIDMRKCGHLRMDEAYHKYFFDLVHGFEVWEAGWKAVCCPEVTVTHLGGATIKWGSAEANAFQEKDRVSFVRSWIASGRLNKLREGVWRKFPYLLQIEELPRAVERFLSGALQLPPAAMDDQLGQLLDQTVSFTLLRQRLLNGLVELAPGFAAIGESNRFIRRICATAKSEDPALEVRWLLLLAERLFQGSYFRIAEKLLLAALDRHPQFSDFWRALGIARMRIPDYLGARSAFARVLLQFPADIESRRGLGIALLKLQQPEEAAKHFEEAVRLCQLANPKDPRLVPLNDYLLTARNHSGTVKGPAPAALPAPLASRPDPTPLKDESYAGRRFGSTVIESSADPSLSTNSQAPSAPTHRPRILLIPFECGTWQNARAWSYNGYMALEEGLAASGVDFVTLPALVGIPSDHPGSWLRYAEIFAHEKSFDQVWVWLTHNEYTRAFLDSLATLAPVRVGVIMESMEHTQAEYAMYPRLPGRKERVTALLKTFTHALTFDDLDAENFAENLGLATLWIPPVVPWRCVCAQVRLPTPGPAVFYGTLYSPERQAYLRHSALKDKLIHPTLPEEKTNLPQRFDQLHAKVLPKLAQATRPDEGLLESYLVELRALRQQLFDLWLDGLRAGYASVNLPSVFKSYAGRVVESMAAGRPVISWEPPRRRTRALFTPCEEILLFDRADPGQLAAHIDRLRHDPAYATALAEHARAKVLGHHTAEIRVRQILDWIDHGALPDYGEAKLPNDEGQPIQHLNLPEPVNASAVKPSPTPQQPKPEAKVMPACVKMASLDEARERLRQRRLPEAWASTLAALRARPFHPEAFLLLAEIAQSAGDSVSARHCAQHARELAPGWKAPKQFLKSSLKGNAKPDWLGLPEEIRGRKAEEGEPKAEAKGQKSGVETQKAEFGTRLTVCVIAKNEEKFLGQCLASIKGLASQIIVIDTGSTDRTVEIAKQFGAEVYSFPWCDDFSAARNAALEHATGDWILMLDADEELPAQEHERLRADLQKSDQIAYRLPLVNRGQESEGQHYVPRLFRNAPGVYYQGRIHEQVLPSLLPYCQAWGLDTGLGSAQILHHGYDEEVMRDRNKVERNLRLLRQAVTEQPGDPNLVMNLGLELVHSGDLTGGLEQYREAYRLLSSQPPTAVVPELREVLLTRFTSVLYKARAFEEVVQVLHTPVARNGGLTASLHYALGLAEFELKNYAEAAEHMRQCLAKRAQRTLAPINTDIRTVAPQHCLALCLSNLEKRLEAEQAFQAALAQEPASRPLRLDYARFLVQSGQPIEALKWLHQMVTEKADDVAVWAYGAEIALSRREFLEFARDWTGEAIQHCPNQASLQALRGEALLLSAATAEALAAWHQLPTPLPPRPIAGMLICELVAGGVNGILNGANETAVSQEFIRWYQRLLNFGAADLVRQINVRLDQLRPLLPSATRLLEAAMAEASR